MVTIDDILESKKWAAEKSDIDEGCLVLNAYLMGILWFGMCLHSI